MKYKSLEDKRNHPNKKTTGHFQKKNYDKKVSPLAHRYQLLEDGESGWGKDISLLTGVYHRQQDGTFCIDDIRKTDLTRLQTYPKTTFHVGPLPLSKPIEGLEEGQYCLFNWKFTFKEKVNPCEIAVDESKPIVFVDPKDFIKAIGKAEGRTTKAEGQATTNADAAPRQTYTGDNAAPRQTYTGDNIAPRQTDVCVLLYDLLHEANKYCGRDVDAQFYLTDKYISFQHTGRRLSAETILNLCGLGNNINDTGNNIEYHCQGLREFLLSNDHTMIISNGFTIRFDNNGGKLEAVWLEKSELPREIKISLSRNKRFTETIILPFEKGGNAQANYKVGLQCIFEDVQNIAFFANIGKVTVKVKGGKAKNFDRKDWTVSREYMTFVPKGVRLKDSGKKFTAVMFACRHKGNVLVGEEDSPAYCLIPTASTFGFPFLMQLDVHINKTNYTINHRDAWNKAYAEIAGRLFAKWITDLTQKAEYTPESIYAIVPKFDECIEEHPEEGAFIKLFQKGFKEIILKETDNNKTTERNNKPAERSNKAVERKNNKASKVFVIDTNIFVDCPNIISMIGKDDTIILSAKVVDELDNLKYKLEDKDLRNVQKALKNINLAIDNSNVRMEMSDMSLLPRDFDRHNPDNNILSVVLRHKADSPTLLTSDNGLQIKAKGIGINVIGLKEFLADKKPKRRTTVRKQPSAVTKQLSAVSK